MESTVIWAVVWIALILILGVVEIFALDFIFLMLAAGAAAALVATLVGAEWWLAAVIGAIVALLLIGLVRPRVLRALGRGADPHRTGVEGLIGMTGQVAVAFTSTAPGQVRLANGETWSARPAIDSPVTAPPLGTPVVVTAIDGSIAVVSFLERTAP